jgi:LPS export ABC transporter permease LptF
MKIINKYIFKELFTSFLLGFVVFTFLLLLNNLLYLVDLLLDKGTPVVSIIQLTVFFVILLIPFTIPVGLLFAIILTYGRLSRDNELVAMRSVGMSTMNFTWHPLATGLVFSLLLCYVNLFFIPQIHSDFRKIYIPLIQKQSSIKFEDKTFIKLANYTIYINKVNRKTSKLIGVNIYKLENNVQTRIFARYGKSGNKGDEALVFTLYDGMIQRSQPGDTAKFTQFAFKVYKIAIPQNSMTYVSKTRTLNEYSGFDLLKEIKAYKKKKLPITHLETEYYTRWSLSLATLVFCVIGVPLGVKLQRSTKTIGAGVSIAVVTVYHFVFIACTTFAEKSVFPAKYIMWLNNVVILVPGVVLYYKLLRK